MKKKGFLLFLGCILIFALGCATRGGVKQLSERLNQNVSIMEEKLAVLKEEVTNLRANVRDCNESVPVLRKNQADTRAEIGALEDEIQQVKGITDGLRKDISSAAVRANLRDEEYNDIKQKLDNIIIKVSFIEDFLEISKEKNGAAGGPAGKSNKVVSKNRLEKAKIYSTAYKLYEQGKYEKARAEFQRFLKKFPDTELSDNAQFWIGETYFYETKYEEALAEYEKVTKNFPEGDKAPDGLLKQGLTLLLLGEKVRARTIFQQVINSYPYTNQAIQARSKLINLK